MGRALRGPRRVECPGAHRHAISHAHCALAGAVSTEMSLGTSRKLKARFGFRPHVPERSDLRPRPYKAIPWDFSRAETDVIRDLGFLPAVQFISDVE